MTVASVRTTLDDARLCAEEIAMPPSTSMQRPADPREAIQLARSALDRYEQTEVVRNWGKSTGSSSPDQVSVDQLTEINDQLGLGVTALSSFTIQAAAQIGMRSASQQRR